MVPGTERPVAERVRDIEIQQVLAADAEAARDRIQTAERVRDVELNQVRTNEQLADHERVLTDLRTHLGELVDKFDKMDRKVLAALIVLALNSHLGVHLLNALGL